MGRRGVVIFILLISALIFSCNDLSIKVFIQQEIEKQENELVQDPLSIVSIVPEKNATHVAVEANIEIVFSHNLDAGSLTAETLLLKDPGGDQVAVTISYDNVQKKVTVDPDEGLLFLSLYSVTLTKGVRSTGGLLLAEDYTWSFTTMDSEGPQAGSVLINSGADFTNDPSVSLALSATDNISVAQMRFSNSSSFSDTDWVAYETSFPWILDSSFDGLKTVYVWFRDGEGNVSARYSDSITLDRQSPVSGTVSINSGASVTNSTSVTVGLYAEDNIAAFGEMYVRLSISTVYSNDSWQALSTSLPWTLSAGDGTKTVHVWFKDSAGNVSSRYSDTIDLDTDPPGLSAHSPTGTNQLSTVTVSVTFDEAMAAGSITSSSFYLRKGGVSFVSCTLNYDAGTRVATLTPNAPLHFSSSYTAYVTTAVTDSAGNHLVSAYNWTFTTKAAVVTTTYTDYLYPDTGDTFRDFVYHNTYVYATANTTATNLGYVYKINVYTPNNIVKADERSVNSYARNIITNGTRLFISHSGYHLYSMDLDLMNVQYGSTSYKGEVIELSGNGQPLMVYTNDLIGYTASNITFSGMEVSNYSNFYYTVTMCTVGGYTYAGAVYSDMEYINTIDVIASGNVGSQGMTSVDRNLDLSTQLGGAATIKAMASDGDYLYVASENSSNGVAYLYVADGPEEMSYSGALALNDCYDISIDGNFAVVARGINGIAVLDLSVYGSPSVIVAAKVLTDAVYKVVLKNGYLYTFESYNNTSASEYNRFRVYQLSIN